MGWKLINLNPDTRTRRQRLAEWLYDRAPARPLPKLFWRILFALDPDFTPF